MTKVNTYPEKLREIISNAVIKARVETGINDIELDHMVTQLCFEMYKMGWQSAFELIESTMKKCREAMTK